jgi:hypothetical protein
VLPGAGHDGWVFRAFALVNCRCVSEHQPIELAKSVADFATIEISDEFAGLPPEIVHKITCENAVKFYRLIN